MQLPGEFPEIGFDKVMAINVKAPFMLTQALLPQLRAGATAEDPARVIMVGSIDGIRVPIGDNYSYSASKAGIHMMARHMAAHLVRDNITINSIAPGPFESKMMAYRLDDPDDSPDVDLTVVDAPIQTDRRAVVGGRIARAAPRRPRPARGSWRPGCANRYRLAIRQRPAGGVFALTGLARLADRG